MIKKIRSYLYKNSVFLRRIWYRFVFFKDNGYMFSLNNPNTFNEKIQYRKRNYKNPLFTRCSDKLEVKEWLVEKGLSEIVIETYFSGSKINLNTLKKIIQSKGDVLLKANHNSGPVFILTKESTDENIIYACNSINNQLKKDYGKFKNEPWYSSIEPKVLVEKRILPEFNDNDLKDYKFHVFKQTDNSYEIVLHVDYDRSTFHNRSLFDVTGKWLPISIKYPTINTNLTIPKNFNKMVEIAKKLGESFSYVRVDLYNVDGEIFFGELTFAHGGGRENFNSKTYDEWMGYLWKQDMSY